MVKRDTPELRKLFAAVERLTGIRGKNEQLAKILGVSASQLYDWSSGRFEPGGEVTLRLLKWAKKVEAKRKEDADRAATRPALKAQVRNPKSNEKPNSDRRRR